MAASGQSHKQMTREMRAELTSYLRLRLGSACVSSEGKVRDRVSRLALRPMGTAEAWQWLMAEFAEARPGAYARAAASKAKRIDPEKPHKTKRERRAEKKTKRAAKKPDDLFYRSEEWRAVRFVALKRGNGCCDLCGRSKREHGVILHVDHIKPRSRFPALALDASNLQVLCEDCNLGKGNRDTTDWRGSNVIQLVPDQAVSA